jgi:hypothetical protein
MKTFLRLLMLALVMTVTFSCGFFGKRIPMTFDGPSTGLKATEIVPTLDTPLPENRNAIWCVSFISAWKALSEDLAEGPVRLDGEPPAADLLNQAADPRSSVPEGTMYVATGWNHEGVIDRIRDDLKTAFPGKPMPEFPGIMDNSFVAYAYIEANLKFTLPYCQSDDPLTFTDSLGNQAQVNAFGILPEDSNSQMRLRRQAQILFMKGGDSMFGQPVEPPSLPFEFALDLCEDSSPSQIIVAVIQREPTLAAALERIENEIAGYGKAQDDQYAIIQQEPGASDVLLVPDMVWQITHRFVELENRRFQNPGLDQQSLDVAQQDISFRLSRSGAELRSEAKDAYQSMGKNEFILDRPFLVCMRKRGETTPYFVMWVDNAELLSPWG